MSIQNRMVQLMSEAAEFVVDLATSLDPKLKMKATSLKDASKKLRAYMEEHGLGASAMRETFGNVTKGGKLVARISYNGRIWGPETWTPGSKELSADDIKRIELGEASEGGGANEVWLDLPLFIRILEFAREDAHDDIDLHDVAELAAKLTKSSGKALSMDSYEKMMPKGHTKNSGGQGKKSEPKPD